MRSWATAVFAIAAIGTPAWGQTTRPADEQTFPYTGQLTGDNVYVRSGPNLQAIYRCTKISQPDKVIVVGRKAGWLKILPVEGCFCTISKRYVDLDEAGTVGTVTGDNVRVYAAGDLRPQGSLLIGRLDKGNKVKVLGEVEDLYKIAAPRGADYWISAR